MRTIRSPRAMAEAARRLRRAGRRVGLVPTMGALHAGHRALIRAAARSEEVVITTIFVNPLQFGPREDYARYPRRLAADVRVAGRAGADIVFAPTASAMYPAGFTTSIDVGPIGRLWEGHVRPGHFQGVATVVARLLHLTQPTTAYFGQKDYQQVLVIRQMVEDLGWPVRIRMCPTVRERDGLALSSRNQHLGSRERREATALYRALQAGRARLRTGEHRPQRVAAAMRAVLRRARGLRVDYAAAAEARSLRVPRRLRGRVALLVAGRLGGTRVIDNLLVDVS